MYWLHCIAQTDESVLKKVTSPPLRDEVLKNNVLFENQIVLYKETLEKSKLRNFVTELKDRKSDSETFAQATFQKDLRIKQYVNNRV